MWRFCGLEWRAFWETPLAVFELLCSSAHIIASSVSQDVFQGLLFGDIPPSLRHNERKLSLIVTGSILGNGWNRNLGRRRPIQRRSRLYEENWYIWNGHIGLSRMVAVVESHASYDRNFIHTDRWQELIKYLLLKSQLDFVDQNLTFATWRVLSVTTPSKMVPLMSLAEILSPRKVAKPTSGNFSESTWPRWIRPSSSAMKRMRWVQERDIFRTLLF